jgi:ribosomal protein S26
MHASLRLITLCSEAGKYVLSVVISGTVEHVLIEPLASGTIINEYHMPMTSVVDVCVPHSRHFS